MSMADVVVDEASAALQSAFADAQQALEAVREEARQVREMQAEVERERRELQAGRDALANDRCVASDGNGAHLANLDRPKSFRARCLPVSWPLVLAYLRFL